MMTSLRISFILAVITLVTIRAQVDDPNDPYRTTSRYNTSDPYRTDPYNRNQDYNRDRNYNRNDPYNRNPTDQYNRDANRNDPYNQRNPNPNDPYNRDRNDPYNRDANRNDPYNRDRNDPYGNRDRNDPYFNNRYNQTGSQYNRTGYDPYSRDRTNDPYNRDANRDRDRNDPYNRDPYNKDHRDGYGGRTDQYGRNDPYNRSDPYGRERQDQYHRTGSDPYGKTGSQDQYGRDRDGNRYGGGSGTFGSSVSGGSRYGADDGNCCEEYCYVVDEQPYVKLGAKTPYQFAYGKISNQHIVPQCKPIQFWSLMREGTSVPDRLSIERLRNLQKIHDEIVRNYEERRSFPDRGRLCSEDYDMLKLWRWNDTFSDHNAGSLTQQGSDDIKFLARRYQTRLRELLQPYNEQLYFFQYNEGDKSRDSYQAYIDGLFGADSQRVHANIQYGGSGAGSQYGSSSYDSNRSPSQYDPFRSNEYSTQNQYGSQNAYSSASYGSSSYPTSSSTNYYGGPSSRCKNYQQRMDENRDSASEYRSFKEKQEYKEMVRNVYRRLGFRYNLNDSVIEDMYDICRYEKSWFVTRPSPWCSAFTKPQLRLLEYGDDLFYFYKSGYGHEYLNKNLGCGLVKDMYERFERSVNGDQTGQKAIFHFGDVDTMLKTLVALGIRRDSNVLTADNYYQHDRRMWRTSELAPFSGNLAAILYQCDNQADKYKVMFFLNENPVDFPECSVGLCTWATVQQKFQYLAQECRLDWCERGFANTVRTSSVFTLSALLFALFYYLL